MYDIFTLYTACSRFIQLLFIINNKTVHGIVNNHVATGLVVNHFIVFVHLLIVCMYVANSY